ncbi:MAG: septum formation initiator family protein [Bacillota bacterium]
MVMADEAWTGRWGGYARPQRQRAARARQAWAVRLRTLARPLGSVWVMGPALVGMAVLVALALVYLHVACLDTGHRILALEKELRALQADNERLQLAVLRLDSPARVEQVARDKLGMVPVREARVVTAAPDQVREVQPPVTVSWLERVASYLAGLLEGRGVLAGPAR